ncbi:DUF2515 domain-containing protein [Paenibacillus soyae]|uniref:DUF2515 domain-containing protein n=1 Tax=Paenibacillus soyae TaxID=2969249 RepID=A0A9X2MSA8_9BACL|nr:DUF2515 domain-containing protein [Paenibacillus soyae]MCR2804933.1 DUF2515 domain-containing protein [Paenibacillus soyae]
MAEDDRTKGEERTGLGGWFGHLLALPGEALAYATGKWKAMSASHDMLEKAAPLSLPASSVARLMDAWSKLGAASAGGEEALGGPHAEWQDSAASWSPDELMLIERIRKDTAEANRNNVTRTEAYRNVYFHTPELHWALLAHLVSRNGGWNMTDLQGEWLPRLLTESQRRDVFLFLERANALIFSDAYPQLLLYQWSRSLGRSLFHLLPAFGVSRFMMPVWKLFWRERDSALLTTALIVNEQHFIEGRVVRKPYFEQRVLHTLFFGLQSLLQLNGVFFPYGSEDEAKGGCGELRLAGLILENFRDPEERIEFGKRLYAMLFGVPPVFEGARGFAAAVKHSGSRGDYAPHLFEDVRHGPPKRVYEEKLLGGRLKPGADRIYSPALQSAWKDHAMEPVEPGDWFENADQIAGYFRELPLPRNFEITNEYGLMLSKLELAVLASQRGEKPGQSLGADDGKV